MNALAYMPLAKLNGALATVGVDAKSTKKEAVDAVQSYIDAGVLNLENVKNAPSISSQTSEEDRSLMKLAQDSLNTAANVKIETQLLRDSVEHSIRTQEARLDKALDEQGRVLQRSIDRANAEVAKVLSSVKAVESSEIQKTVQSLFDQFRKEVPQARLEEIANEMPNCVPMRAGDLFPCTSYDNIDFGDLMVDVFSHNSPMLEDYVFDAKNLHQALIALSDPLPDNVWLAGERGTGKTEFVTQVAARLKRPLFRVNFDEAMERADFIGANTIENGSVRFKDGVILQAIKTPGAIVLLDEIGFARAQTLATLHAVCERSSSRGLTIAETGERITVASHVAFFCADNSNGFGDPSGNFAGVREQNSAFIDRFSYTLEFNYLPPVAETRLIHSRTGLDIDAVGMMVKFANLAREKARAGILTQPPSIRQLFAWARSVAKGMPVDSAFKHAVVNKFPAECSSELEGIYSASINEGLLQQYLERK